MRSGEFVQLLHTTFDTVRHYEELGLLCPKRKHGQRQYSTKDVDAFEVIREFKEMGLTLEEIRVLFDVKSTQGCGSNQLLDAVMVRLEGKVMECEARIAEWSDRRDKLNSLLTELRQAANR